MGKKRKALDDLDAEQTLHQTFVSAANSISQLFTQAVQQHKKSYAAGGRQALERQLEWVLSEYGNSATIPTQTLLQVLQSELLNVDQLDQQYASTAWPAPGGEPPATHGQCHEASELNTMGDLQPTRMQRYQSPGKPPAPYNPWR